MTQIEKARMVADILHCKQNYGDNDYIYHIEQVYETLLRFHVTEENILCAALLHDTVEDTQMKPAMISKYFDSDIADIVYRVSNENGVNRKERHLKTYPKIASSPEARKVKLADRIANYEYSMKTNNAGMMLMYRKEQAAFENFIRPSKMDEKEMAMWEHLNNIMAVENVGREVFGTMEKFEKWFETPSIALNGKIPKQMAANGEIRIILDELTRIEHGIF